MPNTTIQLKKSSTPSAKPSDLANGELAINFADGKLFYKNTANFVTEFTSTSLSFGTISANGVLLVADTAGDVLTIAAGNNINIATDALTDRLTIALSNDTVANIQAAFDKANAANVLAFNTGIGANAFASATIAGANSLFAATIAGANSAVGAAANAFSAATIAGANSAVGTGANNFMIAVQNGSNTVIGTGANAFASATIAGANSFFAATIAGANSAVGAGANAFASATIAGANNAVGAGANAFSAATIAGANSAVGTGANNFMIAVQNGSNTAVGAGANAFAVATFNAANTRPVGNTLSSAFTLRSTRRTLNFIPGTSITINVDDDSAGDRSNVTITSTVSGLTAFATKIANYTAVNGDRLLCNTTAGTFIITLPATPTSGATVLIYDTGNFTANPLTVARNASTIEFIADDFSLDIGQTRNEFVYDGSTWHVYSSIGPRGLADTTTVASSIAYSVALG